MVTSKVGEGGESGKLGGLKPMAYKPACSIRDKGIVMRSGSRPKILIEEDISVFIYY
jgi:hypothetical protein